MEYIKQSSDEVDIRGPESKYDSRKINSYPSKVKIIGPFFTILLFSGVFTLLSVCQCCLVSVLPCANVVLCQCCRVPVLSCVGVVLCRWCLVSVVSCVGVVLCRWCLVSVLSCVGGALCRCCHGVAETQPQSCGKVVETHHVFGVESLSYTPTKTNTAFSALCYASTFEHICVQNQQRCTCDAVGVVS